MYRQGTRGLGLIFWYFVPVQPQLFLVLYIHKTFVSGLFFLILDLLFPWLLSSIISCPQIIQKELYKHQIVFLGSSKITYCFLIFTYYWMKLKLKLTQLHLSPQSQPQFCMVKTLTSPTPHSNYYVSSFYAYKTMAFCPICSCL